MTGKWMVDIVGTTTVRAIIVDQTNEVAREHAKILAPLHDDLVLLESGLDSLAFAVLVARLELILGIDPFTSAEYTSFPVTFGDFVKAYENGTDSSGVA